MWIGGRPEETRTSLVILLSFVEDRVTYADILEIPFTSMQRLVLDDASIPEELEEAFDPLPPIRIDMQDGSAFLLSRKLLVELDPQGNQVEASELDDYSFSIKLGETQAERSLSGFTGRAHTQSGHVGDFWITYHNTQSIDFEQP
jgi:hypothetical protein